MKKVDLSSANSINLFTQLEAKQDLDKAKEEQEFSFQQKNFESQKRKLSDPNFATQFRQQIIQNIHKDIKSTSEFHLNSNDGKDAFVSAIDDFVE